MSPPLRRRPLAARRGAGQPTAQDNSVCGDDSPNRAVSSDGASCLALLRIAAEPEAAPYPLVLPSSPGRRCRSNEHHREGQVTSGRGTRRAVRAKRGMICLCEPRPAARIATDQPVPLVGKGGFEPPASASRTLLRLPGGGSIPLLSWLFTANCCHVSPPIAEPLWHGFGTS